MDKTLNTDCLSIIVSHIDNAKTYCRLAQTCKCLYKICAVIDKYEEEIEVIDLIDKLKYYICDKASVKLAKNLLDKLKRKNRPMITLELFNKYLPTNWKDNVRTIEMVFDRDNDYYFAYIHVPDLNYAFDGINEINDVCNKLKKFNFVNRIKTQAP